MTLDSSVTGATFMRFSEETATFGPYVAYASSDSTTLPAGEGARTLYAQHKDDEGNETTAIFDTITVDAVADEAGNNLASALIWSFRTVESIPPTTTTLQ